MTSKTKKKIPGFTSPRGEDMSPIEAQNCMRLRVNRIAIIQELKVEDVLPYLHRAQVITEQEQRDIQAGITSRERARMLLDILPTKIKTTDWYKHFCLSLKNARVPSDIKKKYLYLIDFMDNTIIDQPHANGNSKSKRPLGKPDQEVDRKMYPRYSPLPDISSSASSTSPEGQQRGHSVTFDLQSPAKENHTNTPISQNQTGITIESHIPVDVNKQSKDELQAPEDFKSLIKIDKSHFDQLMSSNDPGDKDLYVEEMKALSNMQRLEVAVSLHINGKLPSNQALSVCRATQEVLFDTNGHHLYFKYFQMFKMHHVQDIAQLITESYIKVLEHTEHPGDTDTQHFMTKLGFHLVDFLHEYGHFRQAEHTIDHLLKYLSCIEGIGGLMPQFEAYVHLMSLRNANFDFNGANQAYFAAQRLIAKIELVSFGKDLLDCGELFLETSLMMRERGSIGPSYSWAQKALEEVEPDNHRTIIRVLCNAVLAYGAKWNVKRAEQLAVQAVRQAKLLFGINHPMYVKALQHYVMFSNEFHRDEFGIEVARVALATAQKIYGDSSICIAESHKLLAEALLASGEVQTEEYYSEALGAFKMATDCMPDHTKLSTYKMTLAYALILKGDNSPQDMNESYIWAESEVRAAMKVFKKFFGEISIRFTQAISLLGALLARLNSLEEAERYMMESLELLKLCQQNTSPIIHQSKVALGLFFLSINKPMKAIGYLKQAVDHIETPDVFIPWVNRAFEDLIKALEGVGNTPQVEEYAEFWEEWQAENPKPDVHTWNTLHTEPKQWEKFMEDFQLWMKRLNKIKGGIKELGLGEKNKKTLNHFVK